MADAMIQLLATEWDALDALLTGLAPADWDRATALPGWTVRDNVSHVIGIESMILGDPAPDVDVSHLTHVRDPMSGALETWVEARRHVDGPALVAEFREVTARRRAVLDAMTPEDFEKPGWSPVGEVPYHTFMAVRVFDTWMHEQDIRRAVERPGHLDGPVVDVSLGRFEAALGYVVGKRAGATDGQSVVFEVVGPTDRTYRVLVEGRARVLTAQDPEIDPTVTITLPLETFVALGGGRWDRAEAEMAGGLDVQGDSTLATAVLDNLAFTP